MQPQRWWTVFSRSHPLLDYSLPRPCSDTSTQLQGIIQVLIFCDRINMYLQLQGEIPYSPDKVWKEIHKLWNFLLHPIWRGHGPGDFCELWHISFYPQFPHFPHKNDYEHSPLPLVPTVPQRQLSHREGKSNLVSILINFSIKLGRILQFLQCIIADGAHAVVYQRTAQKHS